jgi:hypothetical protein
VVVRTTSAERTRCQVDVVDVLPRLGHLDRAAIGQRTIRLEAVSLQLSVSLSGGPSWTQNASIAWQHRLGSGFLAAML